MATANSNTASEEQNSEVIIWSLTKDSVRMPAETVNSNQELLPTCPAQIDNSTSKWNRSMAITGTFDFDFDEVNYIIEDTVKEEDRAVDIFNFDHDVDEENNITKNNVSLENGTVDITHNGV